MGAFQERQKKIREKNARVLAGMPAKDWVLCEAHGGKVDLAKLPPEVELEGTSITMANSQWGCSECIAEEVAKIAVRMAREEAEREAERKREAEERRSRRRQLVEDARTSEEALRSALAAREEVESLPDPSEARRAVEAAQERHARAVERATQIRETLRRAEKDLMAACDAVAEAKRQADRAVEGRVEVSDVLGAAFDAAEEAWSRVPRVKREKLRDRDLRRRARERLGRR